MRNRSLELTRQMCRRYPISQIALWRQPGLVAGIALTLLAFPWEQRLLHSLPRSMRRWFVHWFLYQASVMAVFRQREFISIFCFTFGAHTKYSSPTYFSVARSAS